MTRSRYRFDEWSDAVKSVFDYWATEGSLSGRSALRDVEEATMVSRKWSRRMAVGLGAFLVALVTGTYLLMPPSKQINTRSSRRIEIGMTRSEVEAILGGPAGDHRSPPLRPPDEAILAQLPPGERWQGDRHSVYVTFDAQDRVVAVTGFYPGPMPPSWYRSLQELIPLPD